MGRPAARPRLWSTPATVRLQHRLALLGRAWAGVESGQNRVEMTTYVSNEDTGH